MEAEQRYQQRLAAEQEAVAMRKQAEEFLRQQEYRQQAHVRIRDARAVAVEEAELRLFRMVIRSPMDGRVKERRVDPGSKRMRQMDDPHSAEVAELYDPERLRVRVDVPLSEAGGLAVGQPTTITTALLPGQSFDGVVERIVGIADIQRNTLQAKVTILEPDDRMQPETLCRVAFHPAPVEETSTVGASAGSSVWISTAALTDGSESPTVWVIAPEENTVSSRTLKLGTTTRDGYREVLQGLRVNEQVVISSETPLAPGDRVEATPLSQVQP